MIFLLKICGFLPHIYIVLCFPLIRDGNDISLGLKSLYISKNLFHRSQVA